LGFAKLFLRATPHHTLATPCCYTSSGRSNPYDELEAIMAVSETSGLEFSEVDPQQPVRQGQKEVARKRLLRVDYK
jgi:hypothetical protein